MTARNPVATVGHKRLVEPGRLRYDVSKHLEEATVTCNRAVVYGVRHLQFETGTVTDIGML